MPVQNNVVVQQQVYIQKETTNQSFMDMHYFLKQTGRANNSFFLVLYDAGLATIDPRDPNLPTQWKERVLRECIVNYWYFLREIIRIPVQGGTVGSGSRYKLNRGNLAMNFLFTLNYNMFVELPRQFGKTVGAACRYLWAYQFGTSNSEIMFIHKDHAGSKGNLAKVKEIRDALPSYLQMSSAIGVDGKKLKVPNTIITMQHPFNHNKITTFPSARSRDAADKLGRGCTMPMQYYDEFAFMLYNREAYMAAVPAFSTASQNAKEHHVPYGILITTTPGDLTNEQGQFAFEMRNNATPWNEAYYDYTYEMLEELYTSNRKSAFFLIRYTYQQLGRGEDYFLEMCRDLGNDWSKIRREVMLEWSRVSENKAFREEDLEIIKQFCHEPIRQMLFGKVGQYQFNVYEDILDPRFPPIIGVDVSGAMYQDSSAITIVDSKTTRVTATLNCNYIPSDDLADVLYILVKQYMPNGIICVERNGGFGASVIQRLVKTSIKKNLYFEIKEKVVEESFDGYRVNKNKKMVKVFGLDSTRDVRARLIEILYDRVAQHKDKFIAPILLEEMEAMEVKKSGKVEHSDRSHDDQVFSYLMAMYVWYDGKNLMENFGLRKNTIKTDENEDIEELDGGIEEAEKKETISLETHDEEDTLVRDQLEYIKQAAKDVLYDTYVNSVYETEQKELEYTLNTDQAFRKAYNEKFHVADDSEIRGFVTLPSEVFMDEDELDAYGNQKLHGNLYDIFDKL